MLREALLPAAWAIGRARAQRWRGVRFLCYHSVVEAGDVAALSQLTLAISRKAFQQHLELIGDCGYIVVSMADALHILETRGAHDAQYVCITFDDGRLDNFQVAWPVLRSFGYSAHFFLSSAFVGRTLQPRAGGPSLTDHYMDAQALQTIMSEGGSIGSHARTHPDLTRLDDVTLHEELYESRVVLEDLAGGPVLTHAYPFAIYDMRVLRATQAAGYRYGFTINTGTVKRIGPDAIQTLTITRNVMRSGADPAENYTILRGGYDFSRFYSARKRELRTWLRRS